MKTLLLFVSSALLSAGAAGACSSQSTPDVLESPRDSGTPDSTTPADDGSAEQDSNPPPPPSKVDVTTVPFQGGSYILAVPKTYDAARSYPLVLVLHGDGEDAAGVRNIFTFDDVSGDDAIVVYPSGTLPVGWQLYPLAVNDDIRFLQSLIASLEAKYPNIDPNRVFGYGYSSGGFMVNQVACITNTFRAIASNSGGAPAADANGGAPNCTTKAIAAIVVHGTNDDTVDVSSGIWDAAFWGDQAKCTDVYDNHGNPIPPATQVDPPQCSAYNGCNPNFPVILCLVPGMGHSPWWPDGAQAVWSFFQKLP